MPLEQPDDECISLPRVGGGEEGCEGLGGWFEPLFRVVVLETAVKADKDVEGVDLGLGSLVGALPFFRWRI